MAKAPDVAVEFNKMLQADREKRKAQSLAQEIFSRNRRKSAPAAGAPVRKRSDLASRVSFGKPTGVQKASTSPRGSPRLGGGSVIARYARASNNGNKALPTGPSNKNIRAARLQGALNRSSSSPDLTSEVSIKGTSGITIKGIAGPCVVQAQNFAPGTTVADIESAFGALGARVIECHLIAHVPMTIAEVMFETMDAANCVIDTFNGQTADGRVLRLFIKPDNVFTLTEPAPTALVTLDVPSIPASIPSGPRRRAQPAQGTNIHNNADNYRPRYESRSGSRSDSRNARPEIIDGSYGFGDDRMDTDDQSSDKPLYSDAQVPRGPRNGGRRAGRYGRYR